MDKKEEMLLRLQVEIDKKCFEIKQKKINTILARIFFFTCILFIVLPVVLIFAGVNLFTVLLPIVAYFSICVLLFLPAILNNKKLGGFLL